VDHIVAMRRPRAGLEGGRQIQMRDAEVAQVRDERTGGGEAERRGQLQAVGRAELGGGRAHATRFRTTTDLAVTLTSVRAPWRSLPASASGSAVESSSAHCAPKRRRGSVNTRSSGCALK